MSKTYKLVTFESQIPSLNFRHRDAKKILAGLLYLWIVKSFFILNPDLQIIL